MRGGAACLGAGGDGGGQARDSSPLPRCALWEPPLGSGGWAGSRLFSSPSVCTVGTSAAGGACSRCNLHRGESCARCNLRRGELCGDVINVTPRQTDAGMQTRTERERDAGRGSRSRFEVAVAAVPYFPRRRVGSWHDSSQVLEHRRCHLWLCGRSHNPLCRPRLQKSYRGSTVSGYCGVRDEGCPGLIEAIIEKSDG